MLEQLIVLFVLVALGWLLWLAAQPRPLFVIEIRNGIPHLKKGKVTDSFLNGIAEVCRLSGTQSGTIKAYRQNQRTRIQCSSSISFGCQQQLRNMIHAGW